MLSDYLYFRCLGVMSLVSSNECGLHVILFHHAVQIVGLRALSQWSSDSSDCWLHPALWSRPLRLSRLTTSFVRQTPKMKILLRLDNPMLWDAFFSCSARPPTTVDCVFTRTWSAIFALDRSTRRYLCCPGFVAQRYYTWLLALRCHLRDHLA